MGECEIKKEIRQIINSCNIDHEKAINSIARAIKIRHKELNRQYLTCLTKNILKEIH